MTTPEQALEDGLGAEVGAEGQGAPHGTPSVAEAADRLGNALSRLEALVERRAAQNVEMAGELQKTQQENEQLKALLGQLAGRVDAAVARLEDVLEE